MRRLAVLLALVLASPAQVAGRDLPKGSRESLKGARTVWVEAVVGAKALIERRLARELPGLAPAPDAGSADVVLRFSFARSQAYVAEHRDVVVTKANPNWHSLTTDEREHGKMEEPLTVRVTERETQWVWKPVDRVSGAALRRLGSGALLPALDYALEAPDGQGPISADWFARWFVKQYRKANRP